MTIKELDWVDVTVDVPEKGLKAGDIGKVVRVHPHDGAYEVEFSTAAGESSWVTTLPKNVVRAIRPKDKRLQFVRERRLVALLMNRLGLRVEGYYDPYDEARRETGVDVIAMFPGGHRLGIQVTELDTGDTPGRSREEEKAVAKVKREQRHRTYLHWAQNDLSKMAGAISRSITRKIRMLDRHNVSKFVEVWLLISCNLPELGAVASTFIMTPWLSVDALNIRTSAQLSKSKYARAFLHPILGAEDALYKWTRETDWTKDVRSPDQYSREHGRTFWDVQKAMRGPS